MNERERAGTSANAVNGRGGIASPSGSCRIVSEGGSVGRVVVLIMPSGLHHLRGARGRVPSHPSLADLASQARSTNRLLELLELLELPQPSH